MNTDRRTSASPRRPTNSTRNWILVILAALAMVISIAGSTHKNFVQVNFLPMADSLHINISEFAWSTTVFALTIAVASPIAGHIADRFGAIFAMAIGAVVSAGVFLALPFVREPALFVLVYGIIAAFAFSLLSYVPLSVLVDDAFSGRRKGLIYAALSNGPAIGFIVLVPLWVWLGSITQWHNVSVLIGAVFLVLLTPATALFRRVSKEGGRQRDVTSSLGFWQSVRSLAKSRQFVVLTSAFMGCGITMAFIDVHLVPDLQMNHVSPHVTSGTLALLGIMEIVGSVIAGVFCDRGRVKMVLILGYSLRAISMLIIAFAPHGLGALAFGTVFGVSYLMTVVATTLWILQSVPKNTRGTAAGLLWALHSAGAAISSQVGALLAERTNSYMLTSIMGAIFVVISLVLVAALKPPTISGRPESKPIVSSEESVDVK